MSLPDLLLTSSVTHSLMLVLPLAFAATLRALRVPGASIVGGIIAGLLLGPAVLGRLAPETYERFFVTGIVETVGDVDAVISPAEADARRWSFQRPFRSYTSAVVVLTLLAAGLIRRRGASVAMPSRAVVVGVGSALLAGALGCLATTTLGRGDPWAIVMVGATLAVGPATMRLRPGTLEPLVRTAGRVASLIAVVVAAVAFWRHLSGPALVWAAPLLALPAGWLLPPLAEATGERGLARRVVVRTLQLALVPSVAACAAMRLELDGGTAVLLLTAVLAVTSLLGRVGGALLGGALPRPGSRASMGDLVRAVTACAPTQIAFAAVAINAWTVPADAAHGLVLGAALLGVAGGTTTPMTATPRETTTA